MNTFEVGNATDVGLVRSANEDYYGCYNYGEASLFIVCDGMGGHEGGEYASRDAVKAINEYFLRITQPFEPGQALSKALTYANEQLRARAKENLELEGMGSTAVVLLFHKGLAHIAHVGDSRAYLIRGGTIRQMTKDQSLVQKMVDANIITPEEAKTHPKKNVILEALGTKADLDIVVSEPIALYKKDLFIICTDGLFNHVENKELLEIVLSDSPRQACLDLVELAKSRGGTDNITLQIVRITKGKKFKPLRSDRNRRWIKYSVWVLVFLICAYLIKSYLYHSNSSIHRDEVQPQRRDSVSTVKKDSLEGKKTVPDTQSKIGHSVEKVIGQPAGVDHSTKDKNK